ncbi:phosphoribosylglycinamide formyltransferase [Haloglycomyces albus]|uniref:phosphoribosylglycinamide formyltransferase n=1 Tax=Haloglycomyces albus TaxID=526067 RepID=UPI00046CB56C|nr:phosphoribosylglycinamide formyltransferase [Haloglycomyces albus]
MTHERSHSPKRVVVLLSGSGSNLQALLDAASDPDYGVEVVAVGADRGGTYGVKRAERAGVPTFVRRLRDFDDRQEWDRSLADTIADYEPDLVVSAGFLKLFGPIMLNTFPGRVVNTHNSLLPAFPGMHGPRDAFNSGVKLAGATLFFCDPGVDTGAIIAQVAVPVLDDDSVETLTERIKEAERDQLVECVGRMMRDGWTVEGRRVRLGASS